jgi:hypothetical protein
VVSTLLRGIYALGKLNWQPLGAYAIARSGRAIPRSGRPRQTKPGELFAFDLLLNAVMAGLLLGGFYAAVFEKQPNA